MPVRLARQAQNGARLLSLALLVAWSLVPVIWLCMTSFKTRADVFRYPPKFLFVPNLNTYIRYLSTGGDSVLPYLKNTLVIALSATLLCLVLASLAGFAFSRHRFPGRRPLLYLLLATRLLPPVSAVIPLFLLMNRLGLVDTYTGVMAIYAALNVPFATWMMKAFFDAVPREVEEAAQVDGCSPLRSLWSVTLPLAAPGSVATAIFVFVQAWNEFMFALIFTSIRARTVPLMIAETIGELQTYWQEMATLATLVMIPTFVFAYFMQQYLVKGLTAGAIK